MWIQEKIKRPVMNRIYPTRELKLKDEFQPRDSGNHKSNTFTNL